MSMSLPTTMGTQPQAPSVVADDLPLAMPGPFQLALPAEFPVQMTATEIAQVQADVQAFNLKKVPMGDIAQIGSEAEASLHRVLNGFMARIEQDENPRIFQLVAKLKEEVDKQNLPGLADSILNGDPSFWDRVRGLFSKSSLMKAKARALEEVRRMAKNKSKTLATVIERMEQELAQEQAKLKAEIQVLEQLKDNYSERFAEFARVAAFMYGCLDKSRREVAELIASGNADAGLLRDLEDKLQALESRALAIEGTLSRLPSDQLVIRQLQKAGIQILQETTTTAAARFGSIKMTLITIHGAIVAQGVQQLEQQGANLDANLLDVRGKLMKDVVSKAANAPGENRLAQANQLRDIVNNTKEIVQIADEARARNREAFAASRQIFAEVRKELLAVGAVVQPQHALE